VVRNIIGAVVETLAVGWVRKDPVSEKKKRLSSLLVKSSFHLSSFDVTKVTFFSAMIKLSFFSDDVSRWGGGLKQK
jgi:hypothetical protein